MTKRLDQAIEKIRMLPDERQEDAADLLLTLLEQDASPRFDLAPEQIEEVKAALRRADAGHFATDEEVEATFARAFSVQS